MTLTDWHGREIKVGDMVRHAYEPIPPDQNTRFGRGYHCHSFAGTASVKEICGRVLILGRATFGSSVYLGSLLEVVTGDAGGGGYIIPLAGPYREPDRR